MARLFLVALVATLAACDSSGEGGGTAGGVKDAAGGAGDAGGGGGSSDQYEALSAAICARQAACCPKNETEAECKGDLAIGLKPLFTTEGIEIDSAKAEACVA
jgi:hypothetical protein